MKKLYRFKYNSGTLIANREELEVELQRSKNLLQNYLEIESNIDAPEYVARGNGFCESQYSETFLASRIEEIRSRIIEIEDWLR